MALSDMQHEASKQRTTAGALAFQFGELNLSRRKLEIVLDGFPGVWNF